MGPLCRSIAGFIDSSFLGLVEGEGKGKGGDGDGGGLWYGMDGPGLSWAELRWAT